jgi:hypothetical protein
VRHSAADFPSEWQGTNVHLRPGLVEPLIKLGLQEGGPPSLAISTELSKVQATGREEGPKLGRGYCTVTCTVVACVELPELAVTVAV